MLTILVISVVLLAPMVYTKRGCPRSALRTGRAF